jgi:cellular nucleic acid-binding protein
VDCPNEKACNNCRQSGHLARDCVNSPVCNGCSQPGHIARDCPQLVVAPRSVVPSFIEMVCHNCHQPGHKSKDCLQVCSSVSGLHIIISVSFTLSGPLKLAANRVTSDLRHR